jgi:hypothetical protein
MVARAREDPGKLRVAPFYDTEARTHTVRYWAPTIMPGIVQTAAYAAELFRALNHLGHDEAKIAELVQLRRGRQAIFARPEPPDTTILLWEPVLHHQIGTAETMREQLAHLLALPSAVVSRSCPVASELTRASASSAIPRTTATARCCAFTTAVRAR